MNKRYINPHRLKFENSIKTEFSDGKTLGGQNRQILKKGEKSCLVAGSNPLLQIQNLQNSRPHFFFWAEMSYSRTVCEKMLKFLLLSTLFPVFMAFFISCRISKLVDNIVKIFFAQSIFFHYLNDKN